MFHVSKEKIRNVLIFAIKFRNLYIFENNFEKIFIILKTLFIAFEIVNNLKITFENYVTIKFSQQNFVQKTIFKIVQFANRKYFEFFVHFIFIKITCYIHETCHLKFMNVI